MHGTISMARDEPEGGTRRGLFDAADGIPSRRARAVPERHAVAASSNGCAGEEPVHYCTMHRSSDLLVGDQVPRHHACRHQSRHLLLRRRSTAASTIRDVPQGYDWPSFIAMDQPKHGAQRKTVTPMFTPTHLDELAMLIRERSAEVLDESAPQRDLQLGRTRLDRADHADAGDAVRLPVGRAAQADALVGRVHRAAQRAASSSRRRNSAASEMDECAAYFTKLWNERVKLRRAMT